MGPKARKGAGDKQKAAGEEEERADPLQALVLADPFETRFYPFTLEQPRCLLPLANTPLIEYTLEFLANAGVEEVFVYSGAHTDILEDYINRSKWSSSSSPFAKLELIRSTSDSIGDAMRDLDGRAILAGDFLVVYGDVVSNLPLEAALAAHRARRAKDKNAIMTMVLREAGTEHRTKAHGIHPVFVIDPTKDRCLHFEQIPNRDGKRTLSIDPALLDENQELEIRRDLIDCGIDICTPDVLALWSDNFDFQAPRKGFLHSVLKDYELNGKTVHTHVAREHYAARVRNLRAYDAVSRDIVSRWAYPLCPDTNLLQGQSYRLQKGNVYKEDGVALARSSVISRHSVVGKGTNIGDGSRVSNSVIGRRCVIGKNVIIDGAYLWDHVVVGDNTTIRQAVIANEAVVGRRCRVLPGALVSYAVRISEGVEVKGSSRLTTARRKRQDGEALEKGQSDFAVVGKDGDGFEVVDEDEREEDELVEGLVSSDLVYNMSGLTISAESISTLNSESEFDSDEHPAAHERSSAGSFLSTTSIDSQLGQHAANFDHDASSSIYDSLVEDHDSANIQLELTSLRMSTNASEHQVRRAVVSAFMKRISQLVKNGASIRATANEVLTRHKELLDRTMFDKNVDDKVDQVDFLLLLQADCARREGGDGMLVVVCTELYNLDVIESEGLERWWENPKSSDALEKVEVRKKVKQLLDALAAQSEEEDEDEDEEDEDESD